MVLGDGLQLIFGIKFMGRHFSPLVKISERGEGMHYIYECPHKDRNASVCVCGRDTCVKRSVSGSNDALHLHDAPTDSDAA